MVQEDGGALVERTHSRKRGKEGQQIASGRGKREEDSDPFFFQFTFRGGNGYDDDRVCSDIIDEDDGGREGNVDGAWDNSRRPCASGRSWRKGAVGQQTCSQIQWRGYTHARGQDEESTSETIAYEEKMRALLSWEDA